MSRFQLPGSPSTLASAAAKDEPSRSLGIDRNARERLVVGVADLAVSKDSSKSIVTYALGSCIGVTVYDPVAKVGGLLHFMLPESTVSP